MAEKSTDLTSDSPVRVMHLIDGLGGGGSERWVWDIVRLSPAARCTHWVVTFYPDNGRFVYSDALRRHDAYGQPTHTQTLEFLEHGIDALARSPYLLPLRKGLSALWCVLNALSVTWHVGVALVKHTPDIVHVHTFRGLRVGVLLRRLFGLPLVHSVPALFSQMTDAGFKGIPQFYELQKRWIDRFVTGASVSELLSVGIPKEKIMAIHGTIDLNTVSSVQAHKQDHSVAIRRALKLAPDSLIALSVGRLHPSKGHLYALEAMQYLVPQFKNLHWVVLGEGEQRGLLEARAKSLKVQDHVHLIGFQPEPLPYYAAADIYLRTPIFESENLSSYQAMAMGLPVVGFDTGCETELVSTSGHGALVPTRNVLALATAVERILRLPDRGARLGEKGAEYCRQHLDIEQTIVELNDLYVDLQGNKRKHST